MDKHSNSVLSQFVDEVAKRSFGRSRTEAMQQRVCVTCGNQVTGFRDPLSRREYEISGMCQECQDGVFGCQEEDE